MVGDKGETCDENENRDRKSEPSESEGVRDDVGVPNHRRLPASHPEKSSPESTESVPLAEFDVEIVRVALPADWQSRRADARRLYVRLIAREALARRNDVQRRKAA